MTAIDREAGMFDLVLATGVLYHLDNSYALKLFNLAHAALRPGGRLVKLDGCFVAEQPKLARFVVNLDRGQCVREFAEYAKLAVPVFPQVRSFVRHDLLRIPCTHVILRCVKASAVPYLAIRERQRDEAGNCCLALGVASNTVDFSENLQPSIW
jgi:hypothetical protein